MRQSRKEERSDGVCGPLPGLLMDSTISIGLRAPLNEVVSRYAIQPPVQPMPYFRLEDQVQTMWPMLLFLHPFNGCQNLS